MSSDPLVAVSELLRCPNCGDPLEVDSAGAGCRSGHRFDRARQGYLTLLGPRGRRFPGDTTEQVAARERVLASGVFSEIADVVASAVQEAVPSPSGRNVTVLDCGAGTGYHLARVMDRLGSPGGGGESVGIGTEISVVAARRLARVHRRVAALVADTWETLPLVDRCVDAISVVFAPRNGPEFARVLRPGGILVVAVPGSGHLEPLRSEAGMVEQAGDKARRLAEDLGPDFVGIGHTSVDSIVQVDPGTALDLAFMGPSGVHLVRDTVSRVLGDAPRRVRIHVAVLTYRRR